MATEQVDVVEYDEVDVDDVKSGDGPPRPVHAPVDDDEVLAEDPLTATYRQATNHNAKMPSRSYTRENTMRMPVMPSGGSTKVARINCGNCNDVFTNYPELCEHLTKSHNITATVHTITLESWNDYELWKHHVSTVYIHIETSSQVSYNGEFQWRTRHSKKDIYALLTCHRSGDTEHPGSGKRPPRRRVKIGFECSCFAHAKHQADGSVIVRYCLDHYGHDTDESLLKHKYPKITVVMDDEESAENGGKPLIIQRMPAAKPRPKRPPNQQRQTKRYRRIGMPLASKITHYINNGIDEVVTPTVVAYEEDEEGQAIYYIMENEQAVQVAETYNGSTVTVNDVELQVVTDPAVIEQVLTMNPVDEEAQPIETQTASAAIDGPALIEDDEAQQTREQAGTIKVEYSNKVTPTAANNVQSKTQKNRPQTRSSRKTAHKPDDTDEILDVVEA